MRFKLLMLATILPLLSFSQNDEKKLLKLEYDWLMAEFAIDTAFISRLMDDSFISIGPSGTQNKREELAGIYDNMQTRKRQNHVVDSLFFDDVTINIYHHVAIVTFVSVTSGRKNNVWFSNQQTRMYDVWVKRNGEWKAVSSQVTPLLRVLKGALL